MPGKKPLAKKLRLIAAAKKKPAPRWADLKKHGKRARTRRSMLQSHGEEEG